jgi:hypothetical protein
MRIKIVVTLCALLFVAGAARPGDARALSFVDTQVKMNILLLQGYINTQAESKSFVYPLRTDVKKSGGLVAPVWPGNPWTGGTMTPGTSRGTYTYTVKADLSGYTLVGHLSKGSYRVTGSVPKWLKSERDQATRTGVNLAGEAIMRAARLTGTLPAAATAADLLPLMWPWPLNACSGVPMAVSPAVGDYGYSHSASGFTITGHLSGGRTYSVTKTLAESQQ